ncbi:ATP-binding cassette domain-containing protein [Tumebacillus permanentifrigoris]|uniref:Sodium transport system ATP-binding protein n=1 Tax=Tumebacillus permanentifrigoris TaxID=378543 RepID=A0A316D278_9BACL|nr:ATP-binding cassette domain-containing protein [Tumebacillus permanentifrigoris]PWK04965.1 sodium transport system ATP-binding protein [Tumebacillus permanentifrigoris]
MILVERVTKKFKKIPAVSDLSLEVGQGEVVGLLGENGAGKTTTLRMISTVLSPTEGRIVVDGMDTLQRPEEVRKRIGILFGGETGLYEKLTARDNIAYFGRLYGLEERTIRERTEELAKRFDMAGFLDRKVGGFSKGMRQKVAIARSVVHDPAVILFDEPTSGLDITSANMFRRLVQEFKAEGKTILFSSHIMSEVERLCDRAVILHRGELQYNGTLEALFATHGSRDLDEIFMNIVGAGGAR